ncbi:DrmB family protein [Roseomonas sp. F4]
MSAGKNYELRRTQLVGAGGIGAVIDIGDESFVVCDAVDWGSPSEYVRLQRMEQRLRRDLRKPPADRPGSLGRVLLHRFPESMFCNNSRCRRIVRWQEPRHGRPGLPMRCPQCQHEGTLVPMRFVVACEDGHLDDVPWHLWVHKSTRGGCRSHERLKLLVDETGTGGLETLKVFCEDCGASESLEGITSKGSLKAVGARCPSCLPWQARTGGFTCTKEPSVLQRGATNLYYPVTASALSLGDGGGESAHDAAVARMLASTTFEMAKEVAADLASTGNVPHPRVARFAQMLATEFALPLELVLENLRAAAPVGGEATAAPEEGDPDWDPEDILAEEWRFLTSAEAADFESEDLVCRETPPPAIGGGAPFARVLLAERLREVRAFLGFRRIKPDGALVRPEAGRPFPAGIRPWLPAVEVFGEGIFIAFDLGFVTRWEAAVRADREESARLAELERHWQDEGYWFLPKPTARLIAIHTLSHLLMRQLVFESGYSSSALRERIYAGPDMAGLLIYTADGDSEGSLGGLVRQGRPDRLGDLIRVALDRGVWCSADPVCRETQGQGLGGFNRAACHACSLVPETSCVLANTLLDRSLLLGRGASLPGLLEGVLAGLT